MADPNYLKRLAELLGSQSQPQPNALLASYAQPEQSQAQPGPQDSQINMLIDLLRRKQPLPQEGTYTIGKRGALSTPDIYG